MLHLILFLIFGVICLAGAINLLAQRHPINSALSLIVVMASLAPLYLLLGAEFVAAIQVIVYAGAIMVLFVFVIMLLNAGVEERSRGAKIALWLGFPGVVVFAGIVIYSLALRGPSRELVDVGAEYGPAVAMGRLLFHDFLLPFEVTSVLILIAIMGAVVLAARPTRGPVSTYKIAEAPERNQGTSDAGQPELTGAAGRRPS
jgi:NADH-quinone oxidoreductase subunit J